MEGMKKVRMIKQKFTERNSKIKKKIDSVKFDTHWFRRVFHTFAVFFLIYYILPNEYWISILKNSISVSLVVFVFILEYLRLKGKISGKQFFGLRVYEKNRVASYLYFGIAILILLLFFPQQISIPCILCACFYDPIIGELRHRFRNRTAYSIGFFICILFFMVTWYKANIWIMITVSLLGAGGALIGEMKKVWWLDDDFAVQILPAVLILLLWQGLSLIDINILPGKIIFPI